MRKTLQIIFFMLFLFLKVFGQQFQASPTDIFSTTKPLTFKNILCTDKGPVLITSSVGVAEEDRMRIQIVINNGNMTNEKGKQMYLGKNPNIFKDLYELSAGMKLICKGPDNAIYVVSENNNFGFINYNRGPAIGTPPFNFLANTNQNIEIRKIWMDDEGTLFIATNTDTIYTVAEANKIYKVNTENKDFIYMPGLDKDSNFVVTLGARAVRKFSLGTGLIPFSFAQDQNDERTLLIGTNNGLYEYDKKTGQHTNYFKPKEAGAITITDIQPEKSGAVIWFSTLEKGLGRFNELSQTIQYYPYPKKNVNEKTVYPVNNFSKLTDNTFMVAVADSLPAIFNKETGKYIFINDSSFTGTANRTSDIKVDAAGNMFITKGGRLYWSKTYVKNNAKNFLTDSSLFGPYVTGITVNGMAYKDLTNGYQRTDSLKEIKLKYSENSIQIFYACRGIDPDSLIFKWKLDNFSNDWMQVPFSVLDDNLNSLGFDLHPGQYLLHIKAKSIHHDWLANEAELTVIIQPPFWQTWWFWLSAIAAVALIAFAVVKWRVSVVRKQERIKAQYEKEALELEAKALRAQMNPHFIFNCMNSIKSLIQEKKEEKAIDYLTTFSKLLRTILQNCDKREITLFDELETCQLYTQLESLRFGEKVDYVFRIDETIDLKSVMVPALIIQPFIENAIWHGIMPKEDGGTLTVNVEKKNGFIVCIIDDNGIGREVSRQNKFRGESVLHQSKGIRLTQSRLDLDNVLNERNATVEIVDKKDESGKASGTKIILTFKED